jgi:tRNA threonylcarbamoyladenosine biosynthesis protein TsaB
MLILALESSAKAASAALLSDSLLIARSFQNNGLTHSVTLLPMAEDLLKNCGVSLKELNLIAVSHGPGSFTGVRIGVSIAKGLAFGLELPAVGVSTLEAMAWNGLFSPEGAVICCVMDARRSQVYNALFTIVNGEPQRLCPDRAVSVSALAAELSGGKVYLVGDGAELCKSVMPGAVMAPEPLRLQCAWGVGMAAWGKTPGDCHSLAPSYLRVSQAEREKRRLT